MGAHIYNTTYKIYGAGLTSFQTNDLIFSSGGSALLKLVMVGGRVTPGKYLTENRITFRYKYQNIIPAPTFTI